MAKRAVETPGLNEFRRDLRQMADGKTFTKELAREQRGIAKAAAGWASDEAMSMRGPYSGRMTLKGGQRGPTFASMIKGRGGAAGARLDLDPRGNAVFWGAKSRTGWNERNPGSRPQHPDWVGANWKVAARGQGPYAINHALFKHLDDIVEMYGDAIDRVASKAFPDK